MMFSKKRVAELEALCKGLYERETKLNQQVSRLTIQNTALGHQLNFWHEQSRTLENQMRVWQMLYMQTLEAAKKFVDMPDPDDFNRSVALAQKALDAQPGIEQLIMAVSMASCGDRAMMRQLFPQLAALDGPVKPPTQCITDATGDRTPLEVVDEPAKNRGNSSVVKRLVRSTTGRNRAG